MIEKGVRIGFNIIDFNSGLKGVLTNVNNINGLLMGKYKVISNDINKTK
ncbi:MAG: nucleoside-triphosphatase [Methanobacterium sp.]